MPKYAKCFARQKIKVRGVEVEVLMMGKESELPIGINISKEMDRVSSLIGYWSAVLAEATGELEEVDAWYRNFRAKFKEECLKKEKSLAEWKINAKIEASNGFLQHKKAIAQAKKNVSLCSGMVAAFSKKANVLQSRGAGMRAEIGSQGMKTPQTTGWDLSDNGSDNDDDFSTCESSGVSTEDKIKAMERINKKKQKSKDKKRRK